jgi:toxin-antitoxin system PIN domain toxin
MSKSTTSFLFPDLNVWLALSVEGHIHHREAARWLESLPGSQRLCFCRFTQLGVLRLLTTAPLMGADEVLTQSQAWNVYDAWISDERVFFLSEPTGLESSFRRLTQLRHAAPKDWADSYLIAFAESAGLHLVTFDKAMARRTSKAIQLRSE